MSPRVGAIETVRIWLALTAWAAAGAWRTWRVQSRRASRPKSATTARPAIRSRSPGRAAVVSGASSIASTENRLWRILGCRGALAFVLRSDAGRANHREPRKGWRRERLTGAQYPKPGAVCAAAGTSAGLPRALVVRRAGLPPTGVHRARAHHAAPDARVEVGMPSVEAAGRPHATSRIAGSARTALTTDTTTTMRNRSRWSICGCPSTEPSAA